MIAEGFLRCKHYTYYLYNTPVNTSIHSYLLPSRLTFLILHHNEHTAEQATLQLLKQYGANLITMGNGDERMPSFNMSGQNFFFDPGCLHLQALNNRLKPTAHIMNAAEEIETFAAYFFK